MADKALNKKKPASADWFVQGLLTKIGDTFDRLMGRGWKPSSSLATSELAERLKTLVDAEARETPEKRKFVPHHIKLKMQWDKFSTDSEVALKKLEHELLTSLIDHINDRRYYTYGPVSLEVKPDYFTSGVKLFASFDPTGDEDNEGSLNVTVPNLKIELPPAEPAKELGYALRLALRFTVAGQDFNRILEMQSGKRFSIGRTKENDVAIDETSVSKMHASLLLNANGELIVSDTGSTNGTFINGERIAYGKANVISADDALRFGTVDVKLEAIEKLELMTPVVEEQEGVSSNNTFQVGEFEFTKKIESPAERVADIPPAETVPSIPMPQSGLLKPLKTEPAPTEPYIPVDKADLNGAEEK